MAKTDDASVRHPSPRGVATAARLSLAVLLVVSCQDPARALIPLSVTSEPAALTAGGVITVTSQQFTDLTLVPSADTTRPNRWSNFAVIVGDDTAESWRVGPTQIAFRVPPVLTGNYDATIEALGYDRAQVSFFAVGLAFPAYWSGLNPYTNVSTGAVFPGQGLLIAEESGWPGFSTGYGLVDISTTSLRMIPELEKTGSNQVKMYTPGPSFRPGHFVFDLSPNASGAAAVWRADPWTVVDTIPCSDPAGHYTVAELSPTTCLLYRTGAVVRNGTDTVLRGQAQLTLGDFRLAPGGKWAVVRTQLQGRQYWPPMPWPVFDQQGNVAYTIDSLFHVTGAAFSADGDTMFLTVSVRDSTAPNHMGGRFALMVVESATGRTLGVRSFPANRALQDVVLDPIRPLIYVGGVQPEPTNGYTREYLTVFHRATLRVLADMPAPGDYTALDANLVFQASRVSVMGWCGVDCGGLRVFTFDLP